MSTEKSDHSSLKIDFDTGDESIEYPIIQIIWENCQKWRKTKMKVKFEVLGVPRSKQRPRVCNFRGRKFSYTPKNKRNGYNCLLPYP